MFKCWYRRRTPWRRAYARVRIEWSRESRWRGRLIHLRCWRSRRLIEWKDGGEEGQDGELVWRQKESGEAISIFLKANSPRTAHYSRKRSLPLVPLISSATIRHIYRLPPSDFIPNLRPTFPYLLGNYNEEWPQDWSRLCGAFHDFRNDGERQRKPAIPIERTSIDLHHCIFHS